MDVEPACSEELAAVTPQVGALLEEIETRIESWAFNSKLDEATMRLSDFLTDGRFFALVVRANIGEIAGFAAMYERFSLFTEGTYRNDLSI